MDLQKSVVSTVEDIAKQAGVLLLQLFDKNTSSAEADIASQKLIVPQLSNILPDVPILAEEKMEGVELLSASNDNVTLPPTYWSVDPLDGSAVFDNKCSEWAVSIALIEDYQPKLGVLHFPRFNITVIAEAGKGCWINGKQVHVSAKRPATEWLIGIDLCKSVSDDFTLKVIMPLIRKFRYVRNFPTVASNLEILLGHTGMWVTDNVRNWDIAAAALAVQEAGGVTQQLDGKPMNWKIVRMPPLVSVVDTKFLEEVLH